MSEQKHGRAASPLAAAARTESAPYLGQTQRRSIALITGVALALYLVVRLLPTGTNLNHMDFRVEGGAKGSLEFCDPSNPQFIPVVQVRSPITLALRFDHAPAAGEAANFTLTMHTASGKPIAPEDLLVANEQKLHLLIIDPTLSDYQHIHPEPGKRPGEWVFTLAPQRSGLYRVFADFTPAATARGLYGVAEFTVPGSVPVVTRIPNSDFDLADLHFELATAQPLRARQPVDLRFQIRRRGGQPLQLQPVMGAFAHLVAFDETRSGFAHLHPNQMDISQPLDPLQPELDFKITIPQSGRYVIWSQVKIEGQELFVPFWVDVAP